MLLFHCLKAVTLYLIILSAVAKLHFVNGIIFLQCIINNLCSKVSVILGGVEKEGEKLFDENKYDAKTYQSLSSHPTLPLHTVKVT